MQEVTQVKRGRGRPRKVQEFVQSDVLKGKAIVGKVAIDSINNFKPNPWNPNKMSKVQKDSLRQGLEKEGWLISQPLLVWRSDLEGRHHNLIIDGYHRYEAAKSLSFGKVPVVYLDQITQSQAKALTIKLNQRRGDFDEKLLSELVQDLDGFYEKDRTQMALDLGFSEMELEYSFQNFMTEEVNDLVEEELFDDSKNLEEEPLSAAEKQSVRANEESDSLSFEEFDLHQHNLSEEVPSGEKQLMRKLHVAFSPEQYKLLSNMITIIRNKRNYRSVSEVIFESIVDVYERVKEDFRPPTPLQDRVRMVDESEEE